MLLKYNDLRWVFSWRFCSTSATTVFTKQLTKHMFIQSFHNACFLCNLQWQDCVHIMVNRVSAHSFFPRSRVSHWRIFLFKPTAPWIQEVFDRCLLQRSKCVHFKTIWWCLQLMCHPNMHANRQEINFNFHDNLYEKAKHQRQRPDHQMETGGSETRMDGPQHIFDTLIRVTWQCVQTVLILTNGS